MSEQADRPADAGTKEIPGSAEVLDLAAKRQVGKVSLRFADVREVEAQHREPGARQAFAEQLVLGSVLRRFHAVTQDHTGMKRRLIVER